MRSIWNSTIVYMDSYELDKLSTDDGLGQYYKRQDIDFKIINKIAKRMLKRQNYELLILYYYYGVKQKNLALSLGITQGAVSQRLKRAKEKIKKIIIASDIYEL